MITVSQVLKQARQEKKLSLEDLSDKTKIRTKHLEALEAGEWQKLPGIAYINGFIDLYARHVDLDPKNIKALFRREFKQDTKPAVLPKGFAEPFEVSGNFFLTLKRILSRIISI